MRKSIIVILYILCLLGMIYLEDSWIGRCGGFVFFHVAIFILHKR